MSQQLSTWQDWPADLTTVQYPMKLYSTVTTGNFSGSFIIGPNHDQAPQNAWFIGPRDRLSWGFRVTPSTHRGVSLLIHVGFQVEINLALSQNIWRVYRLNTQGNTAGVPQNWMSGLKIPHLYCYFEFVAHEANAAVEGFFQLEAT